METVEDLAQAELCSGAIGQRSENPRLIEEAKALRHDNSSFRV